MTCRPMVGAIGAVGILFAVALVGTTAGPSEASGQASPPGSQFRSTVTLIPIDVRVIDERTGKPVTDLTEADFTVLEDGVPQKIGHFMRLSLTADAAKGAPSGPAASPPAGTTRAGLPMRESSLAFTPQTNRVFLIVLGRGRLQEPSKGLDAVIEFVRKRLLPQDHVAVFAYNRATDFTTNHELIARIIERFKQENDAINMRMSLELNGLAGVYGSRALPKEAQDRIDGVFEGAGMLASAELGATQSKTSADRLAGDVRERLERELDSVVTSGRLTPVAEGAGELPALPAWAAFDSFVEASAQTLQDLGNLYAAIGYMRHLDGEKHVFFVTEDALLLPRADDDEDLVEAASDARVAIDVLQTGGVSPGMSSLMARRALRGIAEGTGGITSMVEPSAIGVGRLDELTRSGYLLGYYPSNARWDGRFRRISVRVNRPNTIIRSRAGYYARTDVPIFDRRQFITRHRLQAAAERGRLADIKVDIDASVHVYEGQHRADIEARIDPSRLRFTTGNGIHRAELDIAVVGMDRNLAALGGTVRPVVVELSDEAFEAAKKDGMRWMARVPVPSGTAYLRIVVYDYFADLVGVAGCYVI